MTNFPQFSSRICHRHSKVSISLDKMTEILIDNEVNADLQSQKEANDCNVQSDHESIVNHEDNEKENVTENDVSTIKKKHYRTILDSDSEDELTLISSIEEKSDSDIEFVATAESSDKNIFGTSDFGSKPKKSRLRIESDSDNDEVVDGSKDNENDEDSSPKDNWISKENPATTKIPNSRISGLVDSESEYDNADNSDHSPPKVKNKKKATDRKKKVKADKSNGKSQFSSLIDSDSEDETRLNGIKESFDQQDHNEDSEKKSKKSAIKRTGSLRASKEQAMRVIHSETQRLIRNSEVSLPYHRPKQRSLQDFLNRKKFIPDLPQGLTTAAKVKMSSSIIGKVLVEKEKEAELFYKSSDSEDEAKNLTPENFSVTEKPTALNVTTDEIAIEETQKITKNGVQSSHNKKEIIKQGAVDIGVPRKLFVDESRDLVENERSEDKENCPDDEDEDERKKIEDLRKKIKEVKHGLREGSAPRKLFTTESVDSSKTNNDSTTLPNDIEANSEVEKGAEDELKNMDEGIDSSEKIDELSALGDEDKMDFEQNLPDSGLPDNSIDENSSDLVSMSTNEKELAETSNISETPFISNREYAKLNQREKSSKPPQEISTEKSDADEDSDEPAFGHVYGLPPPDIEDSPKESLSKPNVSKIVPKLRGQPGMMIDLSNSTKPNKDGVKSLVDRFLRHTAVKKPAVIDSPITVLHAEKTANGVQLIEEILPYKLPQTDNVTDKELQKPGAKYARLKNDLMKKMAQKRTEEWKLKEQREKEDLAEDEGLIEDESDDEFDVKLADEVSTESEPEEEDMIIEEKGKQRKNREFADEEAEVSGEDDVDGHDDDDDDEESMDINAEEKNDDENMSAEESDSGSKILSPESTGNKTKRGRIIRSYDDDSNSLPEESQEKDVEGPKKPFERTKTDVDMFEPENDGWLSDTETDFPPSQILPRDQADARSQLCKTPSTAINILRFVSPITQLTALNTLTDSPKDSPMSKGISERRLGTVEKTPIGAKESPISCDLDKRIGFQKKLFEDPSGTVNDEELMGLCSGKFTGMENEEREGKMDEMEISTNGKVTETQLMGLCSGSFPSRIPSTGKYCDDDGIVDENSQDMRLMLDDDSEASCDVDNTKTTKTQSPPTLKVVSSDDDDSNEPQNEERRKIVAKKKVQKLVLSDDEDGSELSNVEDDEEADHVKDKYVDYDSEENEIVNVAQSGVRNVAKDFFEAEAELSESEWGSDDEDEKDLDKLEFEEADEEVFDETLMRNQIGKIHARQVQDDDQREVRMLQELLFDDGDLHTEGGGRERKFKWKNIDQLGEDGGLGPRVDDADDNGDLEEENDLEWRKERLEREKFIEDKMKDATEELTDDLAVDSQIFKLGIKALKKSKSSQNSQKEPDPAAPVTKPIVPRTVSDLVGNPSLGSNPRILHKAVTRGSFLARGDECLARLAVHIKHSSETTIVTRKNPRNCVFTHISPSISANNEKNVNFSTNQESSANSKAKKRKPTAGITPRSTKKAKLDPTRPTGKKLF